MNGIMGMTGLLLVTQLTEEQRDYAGIILKSSDSLIGVLNDVLDFSKMEAGKMVPTNSARIRQILINLIGNALKFTDEGNIIVSVDNHYSKDCSQFVIEFSVKDTGIGIPADKLDHLFQSFSQLHPGLNRKYGGTGLGLAICKRLAEMMGGSISVESEEGAGSTFRFAIVQPSRQPGRAAPIIN